jgi:hypothetical protein
MGRNSIKQLGAATGGLLAAKVASTLGALEALIKAVEVWLKHITP